jgi:hypothetical protein
MIQLKERIYEVRTIGENICDALRQEVSKIGLPATCIDPDFNRAEYSLSRDPASGEDSLIGIWRNQKRQKQGELRFHPDGSFFAEYDVICTHPEKPQWFVEAVTAWGRDNIVKSDPRLLPSVTE